MPHALMWRPLKILPLKIFILIFSLVVERRTDIIIYSLQFIEILIKQIDSASTE